MRIIGFDNDSLAAEAALAVGDEILKINGFPIRDIIDYRFHSSDEELEIEIIRNGQPWIFEIEKDADDSLGIIFEETRYRCCGNDCIFCFIDQNPPNLRSSLYFKDEDFRLSFLYGNYVTLTNVGKKDLNRIVEQRLSPLYISVHSTDLATRKFMLGLKKDDRLLGKIRFLTHHNIELHAQIVLCPGINDGENLRNTIGELVAFYPQLKSIAIVPVGLTRYRDKLYPLKPATPTFSKQLIETIESISAEYKSIHGNYIVYLADEFYLKVEMDIPTTERYDDFEQIENGVGMVREFLDQFEEQKLSFPHRISHPLSVILVSGESASAIIKKWVEPVLNKIENLNVSVATIKNTFYGSSVTVTGLLTGQDIFDQIRQISQADIIVLPANCLNYDGYFLDDWTVPDLKKKLNRHVEVMDSDFISFFEKINSGCFDSQSAVDLV